MARSDRRARTGALVGALAMFLALDVAFLVSLIGFPFAPAALGQAIIEVLPGSISVPLIELLHFWAQRLLVVGVIALFFVAGAAGGVVAADPDRSDRAAIAVGLLPWAGAIAASQLFAGASIQLAAALVGAAAGALVYFATLALLESASAYTAEADEVAAPSRRRALA
ncbi:MAG: hypothetical protein ACRDF0_03980, partial [Candidatus Limnocylindria bacterium]